MSEINDVLKRIKEEHETITAIGVDGWGRQLDLDGNPIDKHNLQAFKDFIKHDPIMLDFANKMIKKLDQFLNNVIGVRDTRELEVKGCVPYEDCRTVSPQFTCHNYVIAKGKGVHCKLGRLE
jgi:hypothetical protein